MTHFLILQDSSALSRTASLKYAWNVNFMWSSVMYFGSAGGPVGAGNSSPMEADDVSCIFCLVGECAGSELRDRVPDKFRERVWDVPKMLALPIRCRTLLRSTFLFHKSFTRPRLDARLSTNPGRFGAELEYFIVVKRSVCLAWCTVTISLSSSFFVYFEYDNTMRSKL